MKTLIRLTMCLALWITTGCATVDKNADAVAVRAEQTLAITFSTFDTFLKLEHQWRQETADKVPEVHAFAEWLREPVSLANDIQPVDGVVFSVTKPRGIALIESANRVKKAYQKNRTEANKERLISSLAAVEQALSETQKHLTAIRGN